MTDRDRQLRRQAEAQCTRAQQEREEMRRDRTDIGKMTEHRVHVGYKWKEGDPLSGWGRTDLDSWARCDGTALVVRQPDRTWAGVAAGFRTEGHKSPPDAMDAVDEHLGGCR